MSVISHRPFFLYLGSSSRRRIGLFQGPKILQIKEFQGPKIRLPERNNLGSFKVLKFSRFEIFRGLKNLSRLEYFRALGFQGPKILADIGREARESKYNIHIPKKLFQLSPV